MKRLLYLALIIAPIAAEAQTATVSWTAPTKNTDGTSINAPLTYNLYQGAQGTTPTKVQSSLATTTATVTAGLTPGTTQCFTVTALANGNESAQSASACAAIPFPTPGVPTQITVVVR